jgi:hypothetical protein
MRVHFSLHKGGLLLVSKHPIFIGALSVGLAALIVSCGSSGAVTPAPFVAPTPIVAPSTSPATTAQQISVSLSAASAGATPQPVPLPAVAGYTPTMSLPLPQTATSAQLTTVVSSAAFSSSPPLSLTRFVQSVRRAALPTDAATLLYLQIYSSATIVLPAAPGFTIAIPSADVFPGANYYLALYDPTRPSLGWQYDFEGPGVLSGTTVTFASNPSPFTFEGSLSYYFALYVIPQNSAQPTPAPSIAPTSVPTQSPPPVTTSSSPAPTPSTSPAPTPTNASGTVVISIPIGRTALGPPSSALRTAASAKPAFLDANSNGGITAIFDGQTIANDVAFAPNGNVTQGETGPSGSGTLPNGGSFAYTTVYTFTNSQGSGSGNQPYADMTLTYTTVPGSHTLGVVQTDGPCADGGPCLSNTNGYVLSEGQQTFSLQPGANTTPTSLVLRGVLQSAYLCDAACDGGPGVYSNGAYDITVFVADESGTAVPYQVDASGNPVPFDNGSYQIVETDGSKIVTITQPASSYSTPGQALHSLYGEDITISCNQVGTTTVAAELVPGGPSSGSVAGFTYTAQNYPVAGSVLGSVGADQYFGNTLAVNCTSTGGLTVQ